MNLTTLSNRKGGKGIRIVSRDGIEIEIMRNRSGTATLDLKNYDDEGVATAVGINLTKKEAAMIVEALETKLHAMKRPPELFNEDTAR